MATAMSNAPPAITPVDPLLARALAPVPRRFRMAALPEASTADTRSPSTALAIAIEQARCSMAAGHVPPEEVRRLFLRSLARLVDEARTGDPAFQAMVLRHRSPLVREHASLSAHVDRDRRQVLAIVNAIAHPAKVAQRAAGPLRDALAALQAAASANDWSTVVGALAGIHADEPALERDLARLRDEPALARLRRVDVLAEESSVREHRALCEQKGPMSGSVRASVLGAGAQRRGDAVEALAASALQALARRLNNATDAGGAGGEEVYRVVTSMRVPPSFPGDAQRAKSEWDVVLLRRAVGVAERVWDVVLLVEAKASADAATTDLPKLLRGLRLLAQAQADTTYRFSSPSGEVLVRGDSLRLLPTEEADLPRAVLYCSDARAELRPRWLNAASRMQLLSSTASLERAAHDIDGAPIEDLEPVWQQLLTAPAFTPVLHQYATLTRVRGLMVHPDDLVAC